MKQWHSKRSSRLWPGRVPHALLPAGLVLAACSADAVDLGDGRLDDDGPLSPRVVQSDPDDEPLEVDIAAIGAFAAVWEGYIEAYEFPSGSDKVRLTLDRQGVGTLTLGEGRVPAPPQSADEPFELGPSVFEAYPRSSTGRMLYTELEIFPWEGFAYGVQLRSVADERIRLSVDVNEVFAPGCALQVPLMLTPASETGAQYGCLPIQGDDYVTAEGCFMGGALRGTSIERPGTSVSCSKQMLCREVCVCDDESCSPRQDPSYRFSFDGSLREAGERLEGSLAQGDEPLSTVRLTRVTAP